MKSFFVGTDHKTCMVDITDDIRGMIAKSGVENGVAVITSQHTTAGITVNESADPDVRTDILASLDRMVPRTDGYRHLEGNSPAHIKTLITGTSATIIVEGGEPVLGNWQAVYLCEYDGPRHRRVLVEVMESGDKNA